MQEQAKAALVNSAPWRKGVAWPIVAIEGLALLGVGIYVLTATDSARDVVLFLIGAILLVNGLMEVLSGFRTPAIQAGKFRIMRGTIGIVVGGLVALEPVSDDLNKTAARYILAVGLIAYGVAGLSGAIVARGENGIRAGVLVTSSLCIVLAILFFTGDENDSSRMNLIGVIGLIFGVLLLAYAYYLYRARAEGSATPIAHGAA